ncbi:MAG TPA: alpha/beta hydrolase [Polyangiaceae bacterium]|jgi:pimeloyl-ACP methyl ester carboxylesterase|nr:alpha/beta hydrolase [Polyangiaceae bacterium]
MPIAQGLAYTLTRPIDDGHELPLVILPGFPAGRAGVAWLSERLGQSRTVLTLDPLGSGQSDVPPPTSNEYAFASVSERLLRLLDQLGLGAVDLLGLSLGGVWAQYALALQPARFARSFLVGSCARLRARERAWAQHLLAQLESTLPLTAIARAAALQQFSVEFLRRPAALMLIDRFVANAELSRDGFRGQVAAMLEHDSRQLLGRCTSRVSVLVGARDAIFPVDLSEELGLALPQAELKVIDEVGHCPWIEAPEGFLALLDA